MSLKDTVNQLIQLWDQKTTHPLEETVQNKIKQCIANCLPNELNEIGDEIKEQIIQVRRKSKEQALDLVELLFLLAEITNQNLLLAIAFHTRAFIYNIDEKDYLKALALYKQAEEIYALHQDTIRLAIMNQTRIWALGSIGKYDEAFKIGSQAEAVFKKHKLWRDLANLYNNLAGIYVVRLSQYEEAIDLLNKAQEAYQQLKDKGQLPMLASQFNEALLLRHLGKFQESIELNESAIQKAKFWGLAISAARGQQTLGTTYFMVGQFNKAIQLMEEARESYLNDKRQHDAILVDLSLSTGLLNLGHYEKTVAVSNRIIDFCRQNKIPGDMARATYNKGLAYLGLGEYEKALSTLEHAAQSFLQANNIVGNQEAKVGLATVYYQQGMKHKSLSLAQSCWEFFKAEQLKTQIIQSALIVGRSTLAIGEKNLNKRVKNELISLAQQTSVPIFTYQIYHLLGEIACYNNEPNEAIAFYNQALDRVESLQGQVITELRSDFLLNKQVIYEELVELYLQNNDLDQALIVAERAKSRALLELLNQRFVPNIPLKNKVDQPIVDRILTIRNQRDVLYRSWQGGEYASLEQQEKLFQDIRELEEQITEAWHQLLVRDANYNRERGLWEIYVDSAQPYLDDKTAVLEYFSVNGKLLLFIITKEQLHVQWLDCTIDDIEEIHQYFWLNLNVVQRTGQAQAFLPNAQSNLHKAYQKLFEPVETFCTHFDALIIIPHGSLHYFPLHALFDGNNYLIQKYAISYMPGSSFIGMYHTPKTKAKGAFVLGNSYGQKLPQALSEAKQVAKWLGVTPILEEAATKTSVIDNSANSLIVHLATHAMFHAENPLFSGVALANDDWLTTLDIFNMKLEASLVTLSACETGRGVIGGGDELLGIMRALLAAGSHSVVLSLWAVEDGSTERLMKAFYSELISNDRPKDLSLQTAQLSLLTHEDDHYHHPYFWAPFFLVGANGKLST